MWKTIFSLCGQSTGSIAITSTDVSFTYGDLREIVPRVAAWLVGNGVESNHHLAINLPMAAHTLFSLCITSTLALLAGYHSMQLGEKRLRIS